MGTNQTMELKLIEVYDDELIDMLKKAGDARRAGKENHQRFLKDFEHKIDIFDKHVKKYLQDYQRDQNIELYESNVYIFRGLQKRYSRIYYEVYPGWFSPTPENETLAEIKFYDAALQVCERPNARIGKIDCYRQLGDNTKALQEVDYLLTHYADNEEVYIQTQKDKDELESPPSSGVERFFRSIFG